MYSHDSGRKRGSPDAANGNGSVPFKRSKDLESNQLGLGSKSKPCTKLFRTPSSIQSENIVRDPSEKEVVDGDNSASREATIKGHGEKSINMEISSENESDGASSPTKEIMLDVASHQENNNEPIVDDDDDDDDDLHNVDEEEEYQKFLAAVLLEGDGNEQAGQGERIFDEDEENDPDFDFEVELEEALYSLESDDEETLRWETYVYSIRLEF